MSSRMRVTKGHSRNRRAHHSIDAPRLSACSNCGAYHLRHRACQACGFYKGSPVLQKAAPKPAKQEEAAPEQTES